MITHAEVAGADWGAPITVVRMACGAAAFVLPDGAVVPRLDFYTWEHGRKATCPACRQVVARVEQFGLVAIEDERP